MQRPATKVASPRHERGDLPAFEELLAKGSFHARLAKARAEREKTLAKQSESDDTDFILSPGRKPWDRSPSETSQPKHKDETAAKRKNDPAILAMSHALKQMGVATKPGEKTESVGEAKPTPVLEDVAETQPKSELKAPEQPKAPPAARPASPVRAEKYVPQAPYSAEDWEELELPVAPQATVATLSPQPILYPAGVDETAPAIGRKRDHRIAVGFGVGVLIGMVGAFMLGRGDVAPTGPETILQASVAAPIAVSNPVVVSVSAPASSVVAPDFQAAPLVPGLVAPAPRVDPPSAFETAGANTPDARPLATSPVATAASAAPSEIVAFADPALAVALPAPTSALSRMTQPALPGAADALPGVAPTLPRAIPAALAVFSLPEPSSEWPAMLSAPDRVALPDALTWVLGESAPAAVLVSPVPLRPDLGEVPETLASLSPQEVAIASPTAALPWAQPDQFFALPAPATKETDTPFALPVQPEVRSPAAPDAGSRVVHVHAPTSVSNAALADVMAKLGGDGYSLDEARRVSFSISKSNIRYFHPEDAELAGSLADRIGAQARDFTDFSPSPPVGTIEIWLSGSGPKVAAAPKSKKVAPKPKQTNKLLQLRSRILRRLRNGEHL